MSGPKARIVLLAIAITAAVAAFAVRGRPGIARVAAAPVESPGGSAAPILVEQDALYYLGEVIVDEKDWLRFNLTIDSESMSEPYELQFERRFY